MRLLVWFQKCHNICLGDGEPFSLIEDFILIISADERILKMLLVNRK